VYVYNVHISVSGYIIPPEGPGMGVKLDEAVGAQHPYNGEKLHLEMSQRPE